MAMILLMVWRRNTNCAWIVFVIATVELGAFYHVAGTTRWGWPAQLPEASRVLNLLANEPGAGRIGGTLDNLPVSAGLTTANPYTGFLLPIPNKVLQALDPRSVASVAGARWLRRFGVTHLVLDEPLASSAVDEIFHGDDEVLDELARRNPGVSKRRDWRVYRIRDNFPAVRLALPIHEAPDLSSLIEVLSSRDGIDEAWYISGDAPPRPTLPRAKSARIVNWDEFSARSNTQARSS